MKSDLLRVPERERGQGLVELALVLPIVLLLVVSVAELGLVYGASQSLIYGSREGARVGSALANGDTSKCTGLERDPSRVDGQLVAAVQRILKSPDSGVNLAKVSQIRIFKATTSGGEDTSKVVNIWGYSPVSSGGGYDIDPDPDTTEMIDFAPTQLSSNWRACDRVNSGNPDSIGVSIVYTYDFVMPIATVVNGITGGRLGVQLKEKTVMALNPTIL